MKKGADITALRTMFMHSVVMLAVFAAVLLFLDVGAGSPGWFLWVVIGAGVLGILEVWYFLRQRGLVTTKGERPQDAETIAGAYRARYFLGYALGQMPALIGFVGVFLEDTLVTWWASLPFALIALWLGAPTHADVERTQHELHAAGVNVSLIDALATQPGHQQSSLFGRRSENQP